MGLCKLSYLVFKTSWIWRCAKKHCCSYNYVTYSRQFEGRLSTRATTTSRKCVRLKKHIYRSGLLITYSILAKLQLVWYFRVRVMMFNATLNTISIISWRTVLFMEETEVPVIHLAWVAFELTMLVVFGTDCICSPKPNYYHTMTATSVPDLWMQNGIHIGKNDITRLVYTLLCQYVSVMH